MTQDSSSPIIEVTPSSSRIIATFTPQKNRAKAVGKLIRCKFCGEQTGEQAVIYERKGKMLWVNCYACTADYPLKIQHLK